MLDFLTNNTVDAAASAIRCQGSCISLDLKALAPTLRDLGDLRYEATDYRIIARAGDTGNPFQQLLLSGAYRSLRYDGDAHDLLEIELLGCPRGDDGVRVFIGQNNFWRDSLRRGAKIAHDPKHVVRDIIHPQVELNIPHDISGQDLLAGVQLAFFRGISEGFLGYRSALLFARLRDQQHPCLSPQAEAALKAFLNC